MFTAENTEFREFLLSQNSASSDANVESMKSTPGSWYWTKVQLAAHHDFEKQSRNTPDPARQFMKVSRNDQAINFYEKLPAGQSSNWSSELPS